MAGKAKGVDRTLADARRLAKAGDLTAARRLIDDLVARFPRNARALEQRDALEKLARPAPVRNALAKAAAAYKAERWAEALRLSEPIAAACPHDGMIQRIHAGALLKCRRLAEASIPLQRLIEIDGTDRWALVNSAIVLTHAGKHDDAVAILRGVLADNPDDAKAHTNLGNALRALGLAEEARPHLERAVALDPTSAEAHNNYGVCLAEAGDRDGARAAQHTAKRLAPRYVSAHRNYANVHTYTAGDPHVADMEALLAAGGHEAADRAMLHFALGKAYDDLRDESGAFKHYAAGNALRSKALGFSLAEETARFKRIVAASTPGPALSVEDGPRPIFIVGMPRSGTSLVEQILGAHPDVTPLGEIPDLRDAVNDHWPEQSAPYLTDDMLDAIAGQYREATEAKAPGAAWITDKAPLNFRWVGLLARAMPDAVVVNVARRPEATCWSIYKLHFSTSGHAYGYNLSDLGGMYRLYEALVDVWHERFPGAVFDLDYDALTDAPEAHITALLAHCGLPFHEACLAPHRNTRAVQTASSLQVRKAIYKGSSDAWERYAHLLGPLHEALAKPKPVLASPTAKQVARPAA